MHCIESFPLRISSVNLTNLMHLLKKYVMENFVFLCSDGYFWRPNMYRYYDISSILVLYQKLDVMGLNLNGL